MKGFIHVLIINGDKDIWNDNETNCALKKYILKMSLYYEFTSFSGDSMGYVPLVVKYFPQI